MCFQDKLQISLCTFTLAASLTTLGGTNWPDHALPIMHYNSLTGFVEHLKQSSSALLFQHQEKNNNHIQQSLNINLILHLNKWIGQLRKQCCCSFSLCIVCAQRVVGNRGLGGIHQLCPQNCSKHLLDFLARYKKPITLEQSFKTWCLSCSLGFGPRYSV